MKALGKLGHVATHYAANIAERLADEDQDVRNEAVEVTKQLGEKFPFNPTSRVSGR